MHPVGCVCSSELLGEAKSNSAHFQDCFLDSLNLCWRRKKISKGKHINASVFIGIV